MAPSNIIGWCQFRVSEVALLQNDLAEVSARQRRVFAIRVTARTLTETRTTGVDEKNSLTCNLTGQVDLMDLWRS